MRLVPQTSPGTSAERIVWRLSRGHMASQNLACTARGNEFAGAKKGAPAIGPEIKAFSGTRVARNSRSQTV